METILQAIPQSQMLPPPLAKESGGGGRGVLSTCLNTLLSSHHLYLSAWPGGSRTRPSSPLTAHHTVCGAAFGFSNLGLLLNFSFWFSYQGKASGSLCFQDILVLPRVCQQITLCMPPSSHPPPPPALAPVSRPACLLLSLEHLCTARIDKQRRGPGSGTRHPGASLASLQLILRAPEVRVGLGTCPH